MPIGCYFLSLRIVNTNEARFSRLNSVVGGVLGIRLDS